MVVIYSVKIVETHGPFNKGRSGEAPENQGNRLLPFEVCQARRSLFPGIKQFKVRRRVTRPGSFGIIFLLPGPVLSSYLHGSNHRCIPCLIFAQFILESQAAPGDTTPGESGTPGDCPHYPFQNR